ncbi:hypothetical protein D3C75_553110 [compost metagenome]
MHTYGFTRRLSAEIILYFSKKVLYFPKRAGISLVLYFGQHHPNAKYTEENIHGDGQPRSIFYRAIPQCV